jgi:putative ABC transport system permease protein
MSAGLLERPVELAEGNGGAPARRAVVRWAWRLFRREWRQQLLILALLTIAVAATVLGAAIGTNTPAPHNAGFGTADHLVALSGADPRLDADLADLKRGFGTVDVIENRAIATGLVQGAYLRAQDPAGAYGKPMLALDSGRYPTGSGEVAMTKGLADTFRLHLGDKWNQGGRSLRVSGLVENPQNLLDDFALVPPGQLDKPDRVSVLFHATDETLAAFTFPQGVTAQVPQVPNGLDPAFIVLAFAIFGLVFVGLVAVAGFSVLAQRRLRAIGMLSSLGATDRVVRLVMLANGAAVGIVSAVLGAALGLAAWIAYEPRLSVSSHHRIAWTDLPWWLVGTAMVLAVVTAVLAAGRPARAVSRIPVTAALSGRPAAGRPVHRSALPGAALLATGLVMITMSGGLGGQHQMLQLGGLLVTTIGLLLLAPVGVVLLGALAGRTPIAVRLALRDLARYRTRSGAALAAVSFAVFTAVVICLLAGGRLGDPVDYAGVNLPANQLLVRPADTGPGAGPDSARPAPVDADHANATVTAIAGALGTGNVLPLESVDAVLTKDKRGDPGTIWLATPQVLRHYGIDPATIDPAAVLLTSRQGLAGTTGLMLMTGGPDSPPLRDPKVQTVNALPTGASAPNLIITSHGVDLLKLTPRPAGWLIGTPRALTAGQINTTRQLAVAASMTIETKSAAPSLDQVRNFATGGGILLALGVLAMSVGLIRSEAARDLRTLAATGAAGGTRRRITGATAGALGLVGALLGTAVAYLIAIALFHSQLDERLSQVPVLDLILILVGLPAAATAGSWLLAGREPPAMARRAIE